MVEASGPRADERKELSDAEVGEGDTGELDPFFKASLSGFKGRLVDHNKEPAPQKLIRFYRTDPSAVIHNPGVFRLAEDATHVVPKMEIKDTRTDDKGRFLITGTWPGTFYIYEADADGEETTRGLVRARLQTCRKAFLNERLFLTALAAEGLSPRVLHLR